MKLRHIINEMGSRMPSSMVKTKSKLDSMNPDEIRAFFKNREDFAAQHRGGKIEPGFSAKELAQRQEFSYGREFAKGRPYSRHFESTELDEGLKDWLQRMAVAGIIVGSVAGIGSINNAINNNVPVIQAMNKALDMANQKGDAQLIQNIKQDIEVARLSLDSGRDLNTVKNMQDRYAKFMPASYKKENLSFKDKIAKKIVQPVKDYNSDNELIMVINPNDKQGIIKIPQKSWPDYEKKGYVQAESNESYGRYWCSTDKKFKHRQSPKQDRS